MPPIPPLAAAAAAAVAALASSLFSATKDSVVSTMDATEAGKHGGT